MRKDLKLENLSKHDRMRGEGKRCRGERPKFRE